MSTRRRPWTLVAHRGGSLEAPENTVAAVRHGVAAGADWQEVDVTLSLDGEVVVIHDDSVGRTCGGPDRRVDAMGWDELATLDAGAPRASSEQLAERARWRVATPAFGSARLGLPRLRDVLAVPGARLMVELKVGPDPARLAAAVAAATAAAAPTGAEPAMAVGSFCHATLDACALHMPGVAQVGIAGTTEELEAMAARRPWALAVGAHLVEQALALALAPERLWCWTVCCPEQARALLVAGAHGLIADCPARLAAGRAATRSP